MDHHSGGLTRSGEPAGPHDPQGPQRSRDLRLRVTRVMRVRIVAHAVLSATCTLTVRAHGEVDLRRRKSGETAAVFVAAARLPNENAFSTTRVRGDWRN